MASAKIVGILNVAPDSFSDGRIYSQKELYARIQKLLDDGADIIDVGAESTAPWSKPISTEEELERLEDFFHIMKNFRNKTTFSLDTKKSYIAKIGIQHGVTIINDVSGWRNDPDIIDTIANNPSVSYICMYCKNRNGHADRDDTKNPIDIIGAISWFFDRTVTHLKWQGVEEKQIILDPGMGAFISTNPVDSLRVLRSLPYFTERYQLPVLIGTSRKGFLSNISPDYWIHDRLASSIVSSLFAIEQWASFIRIHDVHEMRQAQRIWQVLHGEKTLLE